MNSENQTTTRRDFLKTSATLTGATLTGALSLERSAHAAGSVMAEQEGCRPAVEGYTREK